MVQYDDFQQIGGKTFIKPKFSYFLVADIPGLMEGAHKNIGLGFNFLKHVTRCECIFYFLDYTLNDYEIQLNSLKYELEQFNAKLLEKPNCIIISKSDLIKNEVF